MRQNERRAGLVIGLTGGIGSGKSRVLNILKSYGALTLQSDLLAHELMEPGAVNYDNLVRAFGEEILDSEGRIDRKKLGNLVFDNPERLALLNRLTHPNVIKEIRRRIRLYREEGKEPLLALESALLIGSGLEEDLDALWVLRVDADCRIRRLMESRGCSRTYVESVLNRQPAEEYYLEKADRIIDNSGSPEDMEIQVREAVLSLRNPDGSLLFNP